MELESQICYDISESNQNQMFQVNTINQQGKINKDSVNTCIEEEINNAINPYQKKNNAIESSKTKIIAKNKQKHMSHIMKHTKILQTLRNITKNIKSQIITQKPQDNRQSTNKIEEKIFNQQPQIKFVQRIGEKNTSDCKNDLSCEEKDLKVKRNEIIEKTPQKIMSSSKIQPLFSKLQQKQIFNNCPQQCIVLYSKYKNCLEQYPIYEQKHLSTKKQLMNMTIQRDIDNDIESEDEQIQLGVGYLYYELMSSCKKNKGFIKIVNTMMKNNNKSLMKNHNNSMIQNNNNSKSKRCDSKKMMKMQSKNNNNDCSIKQRLIFN